MEKIDLQCLENKIIEDDSVYLRILRKKDINAFIKITQDASLWKYFTHKLSDRTILEQWINEILYEYEKQIRVPFTIINKDTGKVSGSISILKYKSDEKSIEIASAWLGNKYQGQGLIQAANELILNCCFKSLNVERVDFKVDMLNVPAIRSLNKTKGIQELTGSHKASDDKTIYYCIYKKDFVYNL